ncbi:hypothetical protein BEL04_13465 [Mucilaginibacter sp. PPCGB 2223]|uniref:hypothetical protein n=1 Tax=Mucilaginibacter sp. PPCGB 2223 TaxID=1886027 RepID=UPI0008241774|nr:hypothetical protein [Mucilaginibacter sp. PPCGB 2223]OCX52465.1 hypothetical protein BEL04_13465 [Mucilaginibacter sp. PPCGB 2223]
MSELIKTLATKEDIASVRSDLTNGLAHVREEMASLNVQIHKEMGELNINIRKDISENKAESIKWMFIFWIGQVGATLAIVFLFLKK